MRAVPWFIKYKAKKFTELVFSTDVHIRTLQWLTKAKNGVLHVTGPVGSGKTVLVHAAAAALKYNVTEIHDDEFECIKDYAQHHGVGLNKRRNLLLIDEGAIPTAAVPTIAQYLVGLSKNMPIIVTSTELRLKGVETFRTDKMTVENVHQAVKRVLRLENGEGYQIDDRAISKLAALCNSDLRQVLNYAQLYSKSLCNSRLLGKIEHISGSNIFLLCDRLFKRRIRFAELESTYDNRSFDLCLGSLMAGCQNVGFIAKYLAKASAAAGLPRSYEFLELDHINQHVGDFVYQKEMQHPKKQLSFSQRCDPLHFLPHIIRNKNNHRSTRHLQAIFRSYGLKNLSGVDSEILNLAEFEAVESKSFKYKYNQGSSNAVRRDISLSEILEL